MLKEEWHMGLKQYFCSPVHQTPAAQGAQVRFPLCPEVKGKKTERATPQPG